MKRTKGVDMYRVSPERLAPSSGYVALCHGAGSSRTFAGCPLIADGGGITAGVASEICLSTSLLQELQASTAGNPLMGPAA